MENTKYQELSKSISLEGKNIIRRKTLGKMLFSLVLRYTLFILFFFLMKLCFYVEAQANHKLRM